MKFPALSVPVQAAPLAWSDGKLYLFSSLFAVGNLLVPLALHGVPNAGPMFLPLFFFTLIAGWQFGWGTGLVVAVVSPVLNTLLVGMPVPTMLPVVLAKSVALALAAALLSRTTRSVSLWGLALAVLSLQTVGFLAERVTNVPLALSSQLLALSVPGMLILWLGGWAVLRLLNRK